MSYAKPGPILTVTLTGPIEVAASATYRYALRLTSLGSRPSGPLQVGLLAIGGGSFKLGRPFSQVHNGVSFANVPGVAPGKSELIPFSIVTAPAFATRRFALNASVSLRQDASRGSPGSSQWDANDC